MDNPYSPPEHDEAARVQRSAELTAMRERHVREEVVVRSAAVMGFVNAGAEVVTIVVTLLEPSSVRPAHLVLVGALALGWVVGSIQLFRLRHRGRLAFALLAAVTATMHTLAFTADFAVGHAVATTMLLVFAFGLFARRLRVVFSRYYVERVVPATRGVRANVVARVVPLVALSLYLVVVTATRLGVSP